MVYNSWNAVLIHYLFLPLINEDLQRFQHAWNHHKLRTIHNQSPEQILLLNNHLSDALADDNTIVQMNNDELELNHPTNNLPVDEINNSLSDEQYEILILDFQPVSLEETNKTNMWNTLIAIQLYGYILSENME